MTRNEKAPFKLHSLGQFALPVSDADRAEQFYADTLGLKRLFRFGDLVFFDCDGVRLMLEGTTGTIAPTGGVCHYFKVKDIDSAVVGLANNGLVFDDEPHLIANMPDHELWMTFFRDPDGHTLALMEERMLEE